MKSTKKWALQGHHDSAKKQQLLAARYLDRHYPPRTPPGRSTLHSHVNEGGSPLPGIRIPHDNLENRGSCLVACQDYAFNEPPFLKAFFPSTLFLLHRWTHPNLNQPASHVSIKTLAFKKRTPPLCVAIFKMMLLNNETRNLVLF